MSPQDERPEQTPEGQRPEPQGGYQHGQVLGGGGPSQPAGGSQQSSPYQPQNPYPGPRQQGGPQPGYQPQPGPYQQQMGPQHTGGMPPYPQQGFGYGPRIPATPDGEPLSGWWRRVAARILDGLIVGIGSLPLTGYFYWQYTKILLAYTDEMMDRAMAGEQPPAQFNLPMEAWQWAIPATLIGLVVAFIYEYLFLTKTGATLGKKAMGISVRLRDQPGPPPGSAVLKRFGLYNGISLLGAVPMVGNIFGLLGLLNSLWPLWDDKKQALHDKVAKTNVVRKP